MSVLTRNSFGNLIGTTNADIPFVEGEVIEFSGELYVVTESGETRGCVREFCDTEGKQQHTFYWEFEDESCRRAVEPKQDWCQ